MGHTFLDNPPTESTGPHERGFSFINAAVLIAKAQLWAERDEKIKQKYEKINNEILPKPGILLLNSKASH